MLIIMFFICRTDFCWRQMTWNWQKNSSVMANKGKWNRSKRYAMTSLPLKPVMEIICNTPGCNLQGPLADALEAWCALCVAAREPFFSEDGQFGYRLELPEVDDRMGSLMLPKMANGIK